MNILFFKTISYLRCENYGRPKPTVSWFKNKKMLNLTEEKYKLIDDRLQIFRVHSVDSGIYECSISNDYGSINRDFNVTINQIIIKQRHILLIVSISIISFISLVLLALVSIRLIKQKQENTRLKVRIFFIFKSRSYNKKH